MIETTKIWELNCVSEPTSSSIDALRKKYGSKRSGTIYIVASSQGEAQAIIKELFTRSGYTPPKKIVVSPTHLVQQALRMIP